MTRIEAPNLVLAGFMGTGKSTLGPFLARKLGFEFVDIDASIEAIESKSVSAIFAEDGEAAFRTLETQVCQEVALQRGRVVATGGGALLKAANRSVLEKMGVIVLLTCGREELLRRLEESARRGERPLLAKRFVEKVDELLAARAALYASIPLSVDTSHLSPEEAAEQVLALYRSAIGEKEAVCTT